MYAEVIDQIFEEFLRALDRDDIEADEEVSQPQVCPCHVYSEWNMCLDVWYSSGDTKCCPDMAARCLERNIIKVCHTIPVARAYHYIFMCPAVSWIPLKELQGTSSRSMSSAH